MESIKFDRKDGNIVINIPEELLCFAVENDPQWPLIIHDQDKFVEGIIFALEYGLRDDESGLTDFKQLLDSAAIYLIEDGVEYVDLKDSDNEAT